MEGVLIDNGSASSSSSSTIRWNYDVFLSFRGEDTRYNFTGHLYTGLVQAGIRTFIDDEELEKGEESSRNLPEAIEESRISIIVFSRNYASSTWCLKELVKILECRREPIEQTVLPIFLDGVDPSTIRKIAGGYGQAFRRHEERFKREIVDRWRAALVEASELSGWNLKDVANGHESKLIQIVVKRVLSKLNTIPLDVAKHPVGIDSHLAEMLKLLSYSSAESNHLKIVGICGMGGIGKTTIAKAVYNQIFCCFEGSSFLEDVREASKQPNGLVRLQNQLLSDILKQKIRLISNVSRGKNQIRKLVRAKKVLVILDDVDDNCQLQALAGERDWFGLGSMVIITSRDKHVLKVHQVKKIYEPNELDFQQSLQLFSNHAFGRDQPPDDYIELTKNVVYTTGGLPLALEVLGSFLFERMKNEWENTLEKLKKIPSKKVQEKLKISYDALEEPYKDIFLDIACFSSGTHKEYMNYMLESCNSYFTIGINILVEKSLLKKIGKDKVLWMHDQLRDMGREIVRKESPNEPGKRSRLWFHEEALHVLKEHMGTRHVKGLLLNFNHGKDMSEERHFSTETFSTMSNLKLLQIDDACLVGDLKHLPSELRCLSLRRCLLEFIPANFHLQKLVLLDLSHSKISQIWDMWYRKEMFEKLKVLNLRGCDFITRIPHFSGLSNLEILNLGWCEELVEVHESIGNLKKLVFLDLSGCKKVVELPSNICMLSSLQNLFLSHCLKLTKLPKELSSMVSLSELLVDHTAIEKLPDSIGLLKNLTRLCLTECGSLTKLPDSLGRLELTYLELSGTRITKLPDSHENPFKLESIQLGACQSFSKIPSWIVKARNLTDFCLDGTIITELPDAIGLLENLKKFSVSGCKKLMTLPDSMGKMIFLEVLEMKDTGIIKLPESFGELSSLDRLDISGSRDLKILPENFGNLVQLRMLEMVDTGIIKLPENFGELSRLEWLEISGCQELESLPDNFRNLVRLDNLSITETGLLKLPENFGGLSNLQRLKISGCRKLEGLPKSIGNLIRLDKLTVTNCNIFEGANISDIEKLFSLRYLELGGNNFHTLPAEISNLYRLSQLNLENCTKLQALPELPSTLSSLDIRNCLSLERFPDISNLKNLEWLYLTNCTKVQSLLHSSEQVDATSYMSPIQLLVQQGLFEHVRDFYFHGSNIPDWFVPVQFSLTYEEYGVCEEKWVSSFAEVAQPRPLNPDIKITGLILCLSIASKGNGGGDSWAHVDITVKMNEETITHSVWIGNIGFKVKDYDQIYLRTFHEKFRFLQDLKVGSQIQVVIRPCSSLTGKMDVKKGGIYLVYNSSEQSTYKRLAYFLTSSGAVVGDGMSRKDSLDLNAIDSGKACRLIMDESKANGPDNDRNVVPPNPKKRKRDILLDQSLTQAILDSLTASFSKMSLDAVDHDDIPPKPKKPKKIHC